jgi:hypothetical protein
MVGMVIHYVKPTTPRARLPQNYFHAILGIAIIGGSYYTVHEGYADQWPQATGRKAAASVTPAFIVVGIAFPLLYVLGLVLLPKQYKKERAARTMLGDGRF